MAYEVRDAGGDDPRTGDPLRRRSGGGPRRRTATLVAVTVLAATLGAGVSLTGQWHADPPLVVAGGWSRVLAVAQPATLTKAGPATAASVRINVVNVGRMPIQVVTWPAQVHTVQGMTHVKPASGGPRWIAPGDSQRVVAVVGISCESPTWVTPSLSVRGPDGEQLPVMVRDTSLETYKVNARAICGTPGDSTLTVTLTGTVGRPLLVVRNASDHDVEVIVDPHSPVPQAPDMSRQVHGAGTPAVLGPPVELTTFPTLPALLPASSDITLTLQLHLRGCLPLAALTMQTSLQLLGVPVARQHAPDASAATVDLAALLRSKLARACS